MEIARNSVIYIHYYKWLVSHHWKYLICLKVVCSGTEVNPKPSLSLDSLFRQSIGEFFVVAGRVQPPDAVCMEKMIFW